MASAEFRAYLRELFEPLGGISFQPMFGGLGIKRDGAMFALEAFDTLYFKADDEARAHFEAAGSEPFAYVTRDGRRTVMGYWKAPEAVFDDPDTFRHFAGIALSAAARAASRPRGRKATQRASGAGAATRGRK